MSGLLALNDFRDNRHVIALFECHACRREIDIHFVHFILGDSSQIDLHCLLLIMRR
ncbi:hypothetical protein D3C74_485690 [compost metagenome]